MDWDSFDGLFTGYVLDLNSSLERGLRVNVNQIMNVTGTFLPLVVVGYFAVAATIVVAGYIVYKFSPQICSASNWVYNKAKKAYPRVRSAVAAVVCTGWYTLSRGWNKKPSYKPNTKSKSVDQVTRINKELKSFINGKSGSVSYYPSSGKYYIKGYGTFTTSKLVSKGVSSKLLAEVQYKVLYGIYINSKSKERSKLKDYDKQEREFHNRILKEYLKADYKLLDIPDGGNDTHILKCLYEDAVNNYKYGQNLIKTRVKSKGYFYISLSFFELSLIPSSIYVKITSGFK